MKNLLISLITFATLQFSFAGPTAVPAPTPNTNITEFGEGAVKAGNFSLALSPGYAPKLGNGEWGLAVIGGYQATPYIGAFLRADILDKNFYVASGSATFQLPIKIRDKVNFIPFAEAGVGSVVGGNTSQQKEVFAIAGGGANVSYQFNAHWEFYVGGVVETWVPVYTGISMYRGIGGFKYTF
jgi:hypothetical protein